MIRTQDIMASLPLVASALGAKYGVNVVIGGDQACTNGKSIILPTLPLDCDTQLLALARGFVDHESAHIRHTDFTALQCANLTPMQRYLWNTIEDWRVENALAALFPGCRQHFRWLIQHHFGKDEDDDRAGDNPALSVLNWVLLTVRAWDVPTIEKQKLREAAIVQQAYPSLLSRLDAILDEVRMDCRSTQDAIKYALKLHAVIEEYADNGLPSEQSGQPYGDSAPSDSQTDSDRTARTAAQKQLADTLDASETELPQHLGQQIAEALNAGQATPQQQGLTVARTGHKHTGFLPESTRTESVRNSVALHTRLHGLLQAVSQQPCVMGRRGKLCPQRLHGLAVSNPRVFLKRGEQRTVSSAVHLLVDASGSMSGTRMELASRACYAVTLALGQCRGVNVGVTAFPGEDTRLGCTVAPILRHGERVHHRFSMSATGYTPLAEALWWVMQRMCPLKEERKIICILSDGMPDSIPAAQHALKQAATLGFEVMGLGIQDNNLELLLIPLAMPTRTIHALHELAPALFEMLQRALLAKASA